MSKQKHELIRSVQRYVHFSRKHLSFKAAHITIWGKIALFGIFICCISLFFPWVSSFDGISDWWPSRLKSFLSFSILLGYIWFFILIALIVSIFAIFSIQRKEKLHFFTHIQLSDHNSWILSAVFIFLMCFHSFFLIRGLQIFSANVLYWEWIILCITGSIIMFIWSIMMKKEYRKNLRWSYSSEAHIQDQNELIDQGQDNMKLPF